MNLESYKKNMKIVKIWNKLMLGITVTGLILLILEYNISNLILFITSSSVFLVTLFYLKFLMYFISKNTRRIALMNADSILGEVSVEVDDGWISINRKHSD